MIGQIGRYEGVSGITVIGRTGAAGGSSTVGSRGSGITVIGRTSAVGGSSTVGTPVIGRITVDFRA